LQQIFHLLFILYNAHQANFWLASIGTSLALMVICAWLTNALANSILSSVIVFFYFYMFSFYNAKMEQIKKVCNSG
jgi:hypothetical protein